MPIDSSSESNDCDKNEPALKVKELVVSNCRELRDNIFDSINNSYSAATLTVLSLDFCRGITSTGLIKLRHLIAGGVLERLSLKNCFCDVDCKQLLNHLNNNLRYLNLSLNTWLTDATVEELLIWSPKLQHLSLCYCHGVTDELSRSWFEREDRPEGNVRPLDVPLVLYVNGTKISISGHPNSPAWVYIFEDDTNVYEMDL